MLRKADAAAVLDYLGIVGGNGEGVPSTSTLVASENIPAFAAVTSQGKQASSNLTAQIGKIIGISIQPIPQGFSGLVQTIGDLTNPLWSWTPGDMLFLNGSTISKIPPNTGFLQILGTAKSSKTIMVELGPPILL